MRLPISAFAAVAGTADLTRIKTVFLGQDAADAQPHTVYVGDVRMTGGTVIDGRQGNVIVVLGSSTAAGTGASTADSAWVARYRRYVRTMDPDAFVVNLGVGGYTSYDVMPTDFVPPSGRPQPKPENNVTYALSYRPDAIVVNLPSNDANLNVPVADQMANLRAIRAAAAAEGVPVWFTTTQPRNFADDARRALLMAVRDSIHAQFGPRAIDVWTRTATATGTIQPAYNSGDGIHLNDAGHRVIYEQVVGAGVWTLVTDVEDVAGPLAAHLEQNRPNPATGRTRIGFTLPASGPVRLAIYDLLGRQVARLVDGTLEAGAHTVEVDDGALPSGVYVYRLDTGARHQVRRMVVVR